MTHAPSVARQTVYRQALDFAERQVAASSESIPIFSRSTRSAASGITAASCGPIGPAAFWPA